METRNFSSLLKSQWDKGKMLCVGLDTNLEKIPDCVKSRHQNIYERITTFNYHIVDATAKYACAFKPNRAFYDRYPSEGNAALANLINYIQAEYPDIPIILDQKRDDIGNTNLEYVEEFAGKAGDDWAFLPADAVTVHPTFGQEGLQPFLSCANKGVIILCKTSNPGSGEFQDLMVLVETTEVVRWLGRLVKADVCQEFGWQMRTDGKLLMPLYQYIALRVKNVWNENSNCALVVGATYAEQLKHVRSLVGDGFPLLVPGIGKQGGDLKAVLENGLDSNNRGLIINASSSVIYASSGDDFAEAAGAEAKRLHEDIQEFILIKKHFEE